MCFLNAISFTENGKLVTFGILPSGPETGYGYIKRGYQVSSDDLLENNRNSSAYHVDTFVEKPNLDTAKKYIACGDPQSR